MEILASGFLDSSALEANVGVLALLMGYGYRDGFFWCVVALVIVAIILQLIIGVIMAAKVHVKHSKPYIWPILKSLQKISF